MSKNSKFQRILNPRDQKAIDKQLEKADIQLAPDIENFKSEFSVKDNEDLEAISVLTTTTTNTEGNTSVIVEPKSAMAPARENAPVEERKMSFEEYRRQGIPPHYRNLFFNGR